MCDGSQYIYKPVLVLVFLLMEMVLRIMNSNDGLYKAVVLCVYLPWLIAGVNAHMCIQSGASIEGFGANAALVRFLISVYDFVST